MGQLQPKRVLGKEMNLCEQNRELQLEHSCAAARTSAAATHVRGEEQPLGACGRQLACTSGRQQITSSTPPEAGSRAPAHLRLHQRERAGQEEALGVGEGGAPRRGWR